MKHLKTFESFLSESLNEQTIEIVSMTDHGVSNAPKSAYTKKQEDIEAILTNPDDWSDDLIFKDMSGNSWSIDDLVGKSVKLGKKIIKVEESLSEREFSDKKREELASSGAALPDGSFPIETVEDLKNAIKAYGRSKDQAATAKHIAKRAKALGKEDMIPQSSDFQASLKK